MIHAWQVNPGAGGSWLQPAGADAFPERSAAARPEPRRGTIAFRATVVFTFIALTAPQYAFPVLGTLRIALVTAAVAVMACLGDRLVHREPLTVLTREMAIAGGLAAWAILTLPFSYWPGGSVSFLLDLYFKSLALFWLVGNTVNTPQRLRRLVWAISLMAIPIAGTAVSHFLSAEFHALNRIEGYDAPLTANPNDLALMLNLIIPLSVALFLAARPSALRMLLGTVILLDVVAVILTFSRGGFVTLATIMTMYVWKLRGRAERRWAWIAVVLALLSVPVLPSGYVDRLVTITDVDADVTGSSQLRWIEVTSGVNFVANSPILGAGIGMNTLALHSETNWRTIHNAYLEYAVELGLPGVTLFLLLTVTCIRSVVWVQRQAAGVPALRDLFHIAEGIQISLLAFSVAALFHPVGYHLYFYYMAGLAVAAKCVWAARENQAHSIAQ